MPPRKLMFYYVYSLMTFNKILLVLQKPCEARQLLVNDPTENLVYLSKFIVGMKDMGLWNNPQGKNLLDGGAHFYRVYYSSDDVGFAVGCIEP